MVWEPASEDDLLVYCRAGFEGDAAAELAERAAAGGVSGYCRATPGSAVVLFRGSAPGEAARLGLQTGWRELVFARQRLWRFAQCAGLPSHDRAGPLAAAAAHRLGRISAIWVEHPDTPPGRELARLGRRLAGPIAGALKHAGVTVDPAAAAPRLHVLLLAGDQAWLAVSEPGDSAPWPLGIPRLRLPREAPSRSALKLDEALLTFLDEAERRRRLAPGMTAVDLGAAPGGWSWQLARRGLHVTAVDNGPMAASAMATGLVTHERTDGFRYRPPRPVDWMVCDMVEQPHRVAGLTADWLVRGHCREAVVNLKLPMRQRHRAVTECLTALRRALERAGLGCELACKQLYHDREEVTVHARRRAIRG